MKASQGSIWLLVQRSKARVFQEASFEETRGEARAGAVEEIVGGVQEREAADQGVRQAFAFQPRPGPSGVDSLKMVSMMKLVRQFEVMEDSKDGLGDFHEGLAALSRAC